MAPTASVTPRFGLAPVNWNNDDIAEWGNTQPYSELVAITQRCGYDGIEEGTGAPADPAALRGLLAAHGLQLPGAFHWAALSTEEWREAIATAFARAEHLAAAGAEVILIAEQWDAARRAIAGRVAEHPDHALTGEALARLCGGLNELGRRTQGLGLRLALHPHVGTLVETPEEVAAVMAGTDPAVVGLCLDTGHTVYGGGSATEAALAYAPRICYVHAKDVDAAALADARAGRLGWLDGLRRGVFAPLTARPAGDRAVDLEAVGRALQAAGFTGWVIMECDRNPRAGDPTQEAVSALPRLQAALGVR